MLFSCSRLFLGGRDFFERTAGQHKFSREVLSADQILIHFGQHRIVILLLKVDP